MTIPPFSLSGSIYSIINRQLKGEEIQLKKLLEKPEWSDEEKYWLLNYLEYSDGIELQKIMEGHFKKAHNADELIHSLQKSDTKAFDIIFKNYEPAVFNNIMKITRNESATTSIVHDVFVSLWEVRHNISSEKVLSGWLFAKGYSKAVNYLAQDLKKKLGN